MVSPYRRFASLFHGLLSLWFLLMAPAAAVASLTLTLVTTPSFGIIFGGASSRQFILNTNDTVTGTNSSDYVSGAVAGQFTVGDTSSPAAVNILVDNISPAGGLTVNQALCSYNGGAQQSCDGAGMNVTSVSSATLRVGLDISTSAVHSGCDTASVYMEVKLIYF